MLNLLEFILVGYDGIMDDSFQRANQFLHLISGNLVG
jgi:hypothetical protein